ncbi:hypothetical protein DMA10_26810 [Streptomyces sp. WAC 01420]|nr:hypothetical protein DLM49_18400 [Streptomyces sp. WAC 01438]RSM91404.1 hypothetical protein DMA10_26810 [Streptomyces sp. WAC 01420]
MLSGSMALPSSAATVSISMRVPVISTQAENAGRRKRSQVPPGDRRAAQAGQSRPGVLRESMSTRSPERSG